MLLSKSFREAAKKFFFGAPATKKGEGQATKKIDLFLKLETKPLSSGGGGTALVAGPLKKTFFAASLISH